MKPSVETTPEGFRPWPRLAAWTAVILLMAMPLSGRSATQLANETKMEMTMTMRASGTFEITLTPEGEPDESAGTTMGRMSIDKTFHGDLESTSKGTMLSARTSTQGSAGYVALERVSGSLNGRTGGFVLQHSGSMSRGTPSLIVNVVPDSGSGELKGLVGTMTIDIVDGKHFYEFEYAFQEED